jgi:hypothetical protein
VAELKFGGYVADDQKWTKAKGKDGEMPFDAQGKNLPVQEAKTHPQKTMATRRRSRGPKKKKAWPTRQGHTSTLPH